MATRSGARGFEAEVALKVLHPHLASLEGARRMLFHEARVASLVRHPNVVHIEDFGEDEGHTYIEMELVDGAALCSLLGALAARGVSIPTSLAVHLAREVALALHAAHEVEEADGTPAGIVHRDVSPKNILISKRGFVKLCDFGMRMFFGLTSR